MCILIFPIKRVGQLAHGFGNLHAILVGVSELLDVDDPGPTFCPRHAPAPKSPVDNVAPSSAYTHYDERAGYVGGGELRVLQPALGDPSGDAVL